MNRGMAPILSAGWQTRQPRVHVGSSGDQTSRRSEIKAPAEAAIHKLITLQVPRRKLLIAHGVQALVIPSGIRIGGFLSHLRQPVQDCIAEISCDRPQIALRTVTMSTTRTHLSCSVRYESLRRIALPLVTPHQIWPGPDLYNWMAAHSRLAKKQGLAGSNVVCRRERAACGRRRPLRVRASGRTAPRARA